MTGIEAINSVQFVTLNGKRLAVLDAQDWESLIEWLENIEDIQIGKQAFTQLKQAEGNRTSIGWQKWDEIEKDL